MKRYGLFLVAAAVALTVLAVRDFHSTSHESGPAPASGAATAPPNMDRPDESNVVELEAGQLFGSGPQVSREFAFQNTRLSAGTYVLVNASCRCKGAFPPSFEVADNGSSRVGISFVANSDDAVHPETIEATYSTTNRAGQNVLAKLRCTGTVIPEYAIRWDEPVKSVGAVQVTVTIRRLTGSAWASYGLQGDQLEITEIDRSETAFEHYDELRIWAVVKDTSELQRVAQRTLAIHVDGQEKWTGEVTIVDRRRIESDPPKVFIHAVDGGRAQRNVTLSSAVPCQLLSVESDNAEIRLIEPVAPTGTQGVLSTQLAVEYIPDPKEFATTGLRMIQAKIRVRVSCRDDIVEIPVVVLDNRRRREPPATDKGP